jgi:tRNA(Ile)-lysidine synthase
VNKLETGVKHIISIDALIQSSDRILVGVSGGADSVGLLVILDQLKTQLGFQLFACHLNHQLRGPAAEEDERFVLDLAQRLNLPFYTERQDIPAIRSRRGGSVEEVARAVRYEFYLRAARHFSANKIALAHHRDDQCETILFNLLRGSSVHGLRGIPVIRKLGDVEIIRPLLEVSKTEIEKYLRSKEIAWRTDHTNLELCTSRNVIRLKLLPTMEEINPSVRDHLLSLGRQAKEMETILKEQATRVLAASHKEGNEISIEQWRLKTLPELVACEVVREMLVETGAKMGQITARHLAEVVHLETKLELPDNWAARLEQGRLIVGPRQTAEKTENPHLVRIGEPCRFGRLELSTQLRDFDEKEFYKFLRTKDQFSEWIDAGKVSGRLEIRHARDGERFHPLGAPGHKKIGDFLTNVKAGWSARPAVVLADETGIIWLVGHRIDNRVKTGQNTKKILTLIARPSTGGELLE